MKNLTLVLSVVLVSIGSAAMAAGNADWDSSDPVTGALQSVTAQANASMSVAGTAVKSQAPRETRHTFDYPAVFSMTENVPVTSMKFFGLLGKAHEMRPGDRYEAKLCELDASSLRSKADAVAPGALTVSVSPVKLPDTPCQCNDAGADGGYVCAYPNGQTCREPDQGATLCSLDLAANNGYKIVYRAQSGDCGGTAAGVLVSASKRGVCQMLTLVK